MYHVICFGEEDYMVALDGNLLEGHFASYGAALAFTKMLDRGDRLPHFIR